VKPIDVVDPDDERLLIPFTVKVKGRKPLSFTVPRYDAIDPDTYTGMLDRLNEIEADAELPVFEKRRATTLSMLRLFVNDAQFEVLEKLKLVQLNHIAEQWSEASGISLGELLASPNTSTVSTVRPSGTTSSPESESEEETSGAA
jgi:hypothetical protein